MGSLYENIEQFGRSAGFKNMTILCKAAGVPRTTMSELNSGRSKDLSKPNAQKFADLLGLSLDDIYGTKQNEKTPILTKKNERDINDDDIKFALFGDKTIDDETYESVKNFAKFAAEQKRKKKEGE